MLFFLVYQLLCFLVALPIIHKARLLTQGISKDICADVVAVAAGEAVVSVNPGLPGPRLLRRQTLINQLALKTALSTLAEFAEQGPWVTVVSATTRWPRVYWLNCRPNIGPRRRRQGRFWCP